MAHTLGAITQNERADLTRDAIAKERAAAAMSKPVYKKKGLYEFIDCYIVKVADNGDGAANWCVKRIKDDSIIASNVTFKDAERIVNESSANKDN